MQNINIITQHRPTYVDGCETITAEFDDYDALVNVPFVKQFAEMEHFSHFAISDNCLMAIFNEGFEWWVVGYIAYPSRVKLRKWEGAKYRALLDGKEVVLGNEVKSSCGNTLTLYDGRTAEDLGSYTDNTPSS